MNAALYFFIYTLLFTTGYQEVICGSPNKLHVFLKVTRCWTAAAMGPGEVSNGKVLGHIAHAPAVGETSLPPSCIIHYLHL